LEEAMTEDLASLIERYVELWNEPDPGLRRKTIEALWAPHGSNYTASMEAIGYDALDARVTSAFDSYVGTGQYRFRPGVPAVEHHNAVKVQWEMVNLADDTVASVGLEFLVLDGGRIVSDHQFIVS
jgi:hypothetical protein